MLRIYVAGAYSAGNMMDLLANMRRGSRLASEAAQAGFAVYVPWEDFVRHLHAEFTIEECYAGSMAWLEVSDAVLLQPIGAHKSTGTQAELARAKELGLPIFDNLAALQEWATVRWTTIVNDGNREAGS